MSSRPWASHAPDAVDALVSLVRAQVAQAGADVIVHDGAWIGGGTTPAALVIGYSGVRSAVSHPARRAKGQPRSCDPSPGSWQQYRSSTIPVERSR